MILKRFELRLFIVSVRRKSFRVKQKWAYTAKQKNTAQLALEHFDFFYKPIFRRSWPSMRLGLLSDPKYCALINNYADAESCAGFFEEKGAMDMLTRIRSEKRKYDEKMGLNLPRTENLCSSENSVESQTAVTPKGLNLESIPEFDALSRTESGLFQFVPTDETQSAVARVRSGIWNEECKEKFGVNEPQPIAKITIVPDEIVYPEHLKLMTYPRGDISLFPQARLSPDGVISWYLLDGASVFPVLALGIQPGDIVLDICAAPGGKSLLILQTLLPGGLVCNDVKIARVSRLRRMLTSYIPENNDIRERIILKRKDAASVHWDEIDKYDKVLVDAPCTTDRHSLQEEQDSIFRRSRSQQRLALPTVQANLLLNAIRATRPGGIIVYSTCTLSPLQNVDVVESAITTAEVKYNLKVVVKDLSVLVNDCKRAQVFHFHPNEKYGALIVPFLPNNFGPTYVCKLQRI